MLQKILCNWLSQVVVLMVALAVQSFNPFYSHNDFWYLIIGTGVLAILSLIWCGFCLHKDDAYEFDSLRFFQMLHGNKWDFFFFRNYLTKTFVKAFFAPMMVFFLVDHLNYFAHLIQNGSLWYQVVNHWYMFLWQLLFTVDVAIFAFAYIFESKWLGNQIRSTQPYLLGWVLALMCYPPFGMFLNSVGWYADDFFTFDNATFDFYAQIFVLVLVSIYVWASVALGFRAGNLVNRGIVTRGPYRFVRHPAYSAKVLVWHFSTLPVIIAAVSVHDWRLLGAVVLSMLIWTGVYVGRAITEEWHLVEESEYRLYQQKVRYRFIPGVV